MLELRTVLKEWQVTIQFPTYKNRTPNSGSEASFAT